MAYGSFTLHTSVAQAGRERTGNGDGRNRKGKDDQHLSYSPALPAAGISAGETPSSWASTWLRMLVI